MTWIGNDIVDLSLADKACAERERFLKKAFFASERDLIRSSRDPNRMFWLLWSMKESAYKVHVRKTLQPKLNPIRFNCELQEEGKGRVLIDSSAYRTRSRVDAAFIHTIATSDDRNPRNLDSAVLSGLGHEAIRQQLIGNLKDSYAKKMNTHLESISFQKDLYGFPGLRVRVSNGVVHPCSISHHGKYGAYAIAYGEGWD